MIVDRGDEEAAAAVYEPKMRSKEEVEMRESRGLNVVIVSLIMEVGLLQ